MFCCGLTRPTAKVVPSYQSNYHLASIGNRPISIETTDDVELVHETIPQLTTKPNADDDNASILSQGILKIGSSTSSIDSKSITKPKHAANEKKDAEPKNFLVRIASRFSLSDSEIDIDEIIHRLVTSNPLSREFCVKSHEIMLICKQAIDIFMSQPMLLELDGDIHGQYLDLLKLYKTCGDPSVTNYLFLGDYVDRGKQSLETIILQLCYKIKYPFNFFMLRGNHECENVNLIYGFYDECKRRTGNLRIWKMIVNVFNVLPAAAIVAQRIFCVHGGISPHLKDKNQINEISRPTDIPEEGLLNDLLWSDPSDDVDDWADNDRGVSVLFGKRNLMEFLKAQNLDLVCRAHSVVEDGYQFFADKSLVTVFSAPNYCGEFNNFGAVMSVTEDLLCSFQIIKQSNLIYRRNEI